MANIIEHNIAQYSTLQYSIEPYSGSHGKILAYIILKRIIDGMRLFKVYVSIEYKIHKQAP